MHGCVDNVPNIGGSGRPRLAGCVVTFITGVVDLYVLEGARAGVSEDGAVHRHVAVNSTLTPGLDHPECPGRHAVDGPVCVPVIVADCDGESAIVCPDDVEVESTLARDIEPAVLTGVVGLVLAVLQRV